MNLTKFYINGEFVDPSSKETLEIINPATEEKIGIVSLGYGNLRSVSQAFEFLGAKVTHLTSPDLLERCDFAVLPGVGTFPDAMLALKTNGFSESIKCFAKSGKPLLGICLGMQIMLTEGNEITTTNGLNIFKGRTKRLCQSEGPVMSPNTGWGKIEFLPVAAAPLSSIAEPYFYFNHSYVCEVEDVGAVSAVIGRSLEWPAIIQQQNVVGIQCHPEKSHLAGLNFLRYFLSLD